MAPMAEYNDDNDKLGVVTKEVEICKLLTSNDTEVRKRGLKSLKKWFSEIDLEKAVQEDDIIRIWNGFFSYVWMSDEPLVQEEAVEFISSIMHNSKNYRASMYYIRGVFSSLVKQWDRISHHQIDKFLMFVLCFLRQIVTLLKNHEWDIEKLELFSKELYGAVQVLPYTLALHLNEIFNEEVAKISKGEIPTDALVVLYKGYIECIVNLRPSVQIVNSIHSNIFCGLVRQLELYIKQKVLTESCDNEDNDEPGSKKKANTISSDSIFEGTEKFSTETCDNDDSDKEEIALDPRPGGVDVFLPFIDFDEKVFVKFLEQYILKPGIHIEAKNILNQIITMFASISKLRISKPDEFIHEMKENSKKRKIQKTMSATNENSSPPKKAKIWGVESVPEDEEKSTPVIQQADLINDNETENASDICLEILEENEKSIDKPDEKLSSLVSNELAVETRDNENEKNDQVTVDESESVSVPVEEDEDKGTRVSDTDSENIVPSSVVEGHPKLMEKDGDYVAVDFKPETVVDKETSQKFDKEETSEEFDNKEMSQEPDNENISPSKGTRTLRSRKVESTPVPVSTPDSKRTRKTREKKMEPAVQRKSSRIAQKQKKVLFKLEDNTYQDFQSYVKVLKSKPGSSFDVSKIPNCGILKPFAVTTPISPFYFPNGERKLKRKRKRKRKRI